MNKIKSVIIDDEVSNRNLIANLIDKLNPQFVIVGEADGVQAGYELIEKLRPEVVFLDIRMPDGTGFTLLEKFDVIYFEVVFISGFDNYALKAFEFNALAYVIKPVDSEKFTNTLKKVQINIEKKGLHPDELKSILKAYDPKEMVLTKIPIHTSNNVTLLDDDEIISIEADEGYCVFRMISGEKFTCAKQLSHFDAIFERLPKLIRANKGAFINIDHISSYSKEEPCFLIMKDKSIVEISRRKKTEVLSLLMQKKIRSK